MDELIQSSEYCKRSFQSLVMYEIPLFRIVLEDHKK